MDKILVLIEILRWLGSSNMPGSALEGGQEHRPKQKVSTHCRNLVIINDECLKLRRQIKMISGLGSEWSNIVVCKIVKFERDIDVGIVGYM